MTFGHKGTKSATSDYVTLCSLRLQVSAQDQEFRSLMMCDFCGSPVIYWQPAQGVCHLLSKASWD